MADLDRQYDETVTDDDGREGVFSRGFLALTATQFFVAFNDNLFRWLVVPVGKELMTRRWDEMPRFVQDWMRPEPLALALGLASFTLPFILFAAVAGFLADRFSKRNVMVAFKAAEVIIVVLGVGAILLGNMPLMFLVLFLLGGQSAMFITSKLGAIPELVRSRDISAANGLINMVSMSAIILGAIAGSWLYERTLPAGQNQWWLYAAVLLGAAVCGLVASLFIRRLPTADPARRFNWNPVGETLRDFRVIRSNRALLLAALGSAYFWTLGGVSNLNIDQLATKHLFVSQEFVGYLLGVLILGIGLGAMLAGWWSRGKIELGLVPLGGLGIAAASLLIFFIPPGAPTQPNYFGYGGSCLLLMAMGAAAGLYDIPLQAFLQDRSPAKARGSIMAAYNFLCYTGILAAAGIYWVLSGPLGLSARGIFIAGGLATLAVTVLIVRTMPYHSARLAVRLLVGCFYRVRVEGLENVPRGGALLAANHVSWLDGLLLGLFSPRHPRIVALFSYFDNPYLRWVARLGRIIPIGTTRKSMADSIRAAREALAQGELVGIFPEGGITRTGEMQEFRPGFLSIIKDSEVPVVPVYLGGLWGSIFSYERGRFFWKIPRRWPYPVLIRFGRPLPQPLDVQQVRDAVLEMEREETTR
jgi:acyl-[acyl-carrier-protein]-phospholipid O-acyltransferase/long-chain-fatty-acid--[acyl-carrier-protein] ligase